jgi:predicted small secreted protein
MHMNIRKSLTLSVLMLTLACLASGCGNTWRGVKEDTNKTLDSAGNAVVKAGEKLKSE